MNDELLFGKYIRIGGSVSGQGGSATVFKVRHANLGYIRAVRILNYWIDNKEDPKYKKFVDECKLWYRLGNSGHPNIVRIIHHDLMDNKAFAEMEWVEGSDLNDYIKQSNGYIEIDIVMKFIHDICTAMSFLHHDIYESCINMDEDDCVSLDKFVDPNCKEKLIKKYRVIHNDIHSKNVIRKPDGSYVLLDFGLAIENDTLMRSSLTEKGAVEYMAPEKFEDDKILSEQSDVYSVGILIFEMLTGQVPFPLRKTNSDQARSEVMEKHLAGKLPSIVNLRKEAFLKKHPDKSWKKDYPDWLEEMIKKCLEKAPSNRFENAKKLQDYFLNNEKTFKPSHSNSFTENRKVIKSTPKKIAFSWLAFFVLLIISTITVIYFIRYPKNVIINTIPNNPETFVRNKSFSVNDQKFRYTGNTINSFPDGEGAAVFDNGDQYQGMFKNGYREGKGKYLFNNGDVMDCIFKADEAYGIGKYYYKDGSYYQGEFYNSRFNGNGIVFNADGSIRIQGQFKDGALIKIDDEKVKK